MTQPALNSCLYEGQVFHRRFGEHEWCFRAPLFMLYLDLAELPVVFEGSRFWSYQGRNLASIAREDYLRPLSMSLQEAVRQTVLKETGWACDGPIRLLTHGRFLGYCFNPISLYYCFEPQSDRPRCIVAEVTSTPWKQRHAYVLEVAFPKGSLWGHATSEKQMHVSPFFPLDMTYRWAFEAPGTHLRAQVELMSGSTVDLKAALQLERRSLEHGALDRMLLRYPAMAAQVIARIYGYAFRLWLSGAPFHAHPDRSGKDETHEEHDQKERVGGPS